MGRDFRKIRAWQLADDLAVELYRITESFPKHEIYGLTSQLRRAVVSVPANIAEGAARGHKKEYVQFINIARGSLAETDYYIHLALRLDYLDVETHERLSNQIRTTASLVFGLYEAVKKEVIPSPRSQVRS